MFDLIEFNFEYVGRNVINSSYHKTFKILEEKGFFCPKILLEIGEWPKNDLLSREWLSKLSVKVGALVIDGLMDAW